MFHFALVLSTDVYLGNSIGKRTSAYSGLTDNGIKLVEIRSRTSVRSTEQHSRSRSVVPRSDRGECPNTQHVHTGWYKRVGVSYVDHLKQMM